MPTGGPGEMGRKEPYAPPSSKGTEGYVQGLCEDATAISESGLKGGWSQIPEETAGTSPSEKVTQNKCLKEYGSFHDQGNRP